MGHMLQTQFLEITEKASEHLISGVHIAGTNLQKDHVEIIK